MKRSEFFKRLAALFLIPVLPKPKAVQAKSMYMGTSGNVEKINQAKYMFENPARPSEMYAKSRYRVVKQTIAGEEIVVQDWRDVPDDSLMSVGEPMP